MNEELYHHGILGQKWGIRRYQNADGSLTKAGRKRYGEDLDINDKSRTNIAKIRKGEAYRRLDVAKSNNDTNTTRIADLQRRVRSAKRVEKNMRAVDKGAKLASEGQTISGNKFKGGMAMVGSVMATRGMTKLLNNRLNTLNQQGRLRQGHVNAANSLAKIGGMSIQSLALAYNIKKSSDNFKLQAYNRARWHGATSIKSVGSSEYADVVKRKGNK